MRVKVELYKKIEHVERFKYNALGQKIGLLETPKVEKFEKLEVTNICDCNLFEIYPKYILIKISEIKEPKVFNFEELILGDYSRIVAFVDGEEILNKELKKETE